MTPLVYYCNSKYMIDKCCNQVEMSVVPQSRNVPLGLAEAWLGRAETSDIAALAGFAVC